jgi:hypothetical protein
VSRESTCRACGAADLQMILDLGATPLANALPARDATQAEPRFPLELVFCRACTLVQITETVPPEELFRDYLYFSSFSDTMLAHARELTGRLVPELKLGPRSLAVEVASNDGYLLQYYKQAGVPVMGIEPARNIARVAEERGIPTVAEFFGLQLATQLAAGGKRADVLHANNVLAHVPDLNGFVAGIRAILADDGVAVLEFPYLGDMIDRCEFDTIYHEHLCYYSLGAIRYLFERSGLKLLDVERLPIHGGSLLLLASRREAARQAAPSVAALLDEERGRGMETVRYYRDFAGRVLQLKDKLRALLSQLKADGKRIAAYGAAAKGSTLLNTFGIGAEILEFVADRSTYKQGRSMPGVGVPIVAPEALSARMPDYTLLLTWNFADEILAQQAEYRRRGGKFIVPIPDVVVV